VIDVEIGLLSEEALRQKACAVACFGEFEHAKRNATQYGGGFIWKRVKQHDYLVKTSPTGRQTGFGTRSAQTEGIYARFVSGKEKSRAAVSSLRALMQLHQRVNKALRVGQAPNALIDELNGMNSPPFVTGRAALFAYLAAAGARLHTSMLRAIGDPLPLVAASAGDDLAPTNQADFWRHSVRDWQWLASAPAISEVLVSKNGAMARMVVADPRAFVLHADWRLENDPKSVTPRDILIAEIVERLIANFDEIRIPN
jgi:Nucleotidyltransferase